MTDTTLSTATNPPHDAVVAMQTDLRSLGYLGRGLDGVFGAGTARGVRALTLDLLQPVHGAAVQVAAYNKGRVTAMTDSYTPAVAACVADMIADPAFPKLPRSANAAADNTAALADLRAAPSHIAPTPFLLAIVQQESGNQHYALVDSFVTIGLDRNDPHFPDKITSRGYGLGQTTLFYHPPTAADVANVIVNIAGNVTEAYAELRTKFNTFVTGSGGADDRAAEHPGVPLRLCRYAASDARYMTDCVTCAQTAPKLNISCTPPNATPFYTGAPAGNVYAVTQYYANTHYANVPDRAQFGCDWPYAVRRYNGSGVNSYHYQAHILLNLAALPAD